MLSTNQNKFLDLLLESGALKFGSFKTKSGRTSPFFFNSGAFDHGRILSQVAECYADRLVSFSKSHNIQGFHLYGPAYKGITLAAATAMEAARITGQEVPFTFNRKERKEHGEGGDFIGRQITKQSRLIIIEDVMTGGTSVRESVDLLCPIGPTFCGVVIGVDRMERGKTSLCASKEIFQEFKIPVVSILTIDEIVGSLWQNGSPVPRMDRVWITKDIKTSIDHYRSEWGG